MTLPLDQQHDCFPIDRAPPPIAGRLQPMDLAGLLRAIESAYIDAALAQTSGNRQRAARLLGLRRTTLVEKLRRRARPDTTLTLVEPAGADDASLDAPIDAPLDAPIDAASSDGASE